MTIGGIHIAPGDVGVVTLLLLMFSLLVTDTLVTGRRLRKSEARVQFLETKVWDLLETTQVAVTAAEVSSEVIRRLPDPNRPTKGSGL